MVGRLERPRMGGRVSVNDSFDSWLTEGSGAPENGKRCAPWSATATAAASERPSARRWICSRTTLEKRAHPRAPGRPEVLRLRFARAARVLGRRENKDHGFGQNAPCVPVRVATGRAQPIQGAALVGRQHVLQSLGRQRECGQLPGRIHAGFCAALFDRRRVLVYWRILSSEISRNCLMGIFIFEPGALLRRVDLQLLRIPIEPGGNSPFKTLGPFPRAILAGLDHPGSAQGYAGHECTDRQPTEDPQDRRRIVAHDGVPSNRDPPRVAC